MVDFAPRSIVVTTDLSPAASAAYPSARSLASAFGSTITVLVCIDLSLHLYGGSAEFEVPVGYLPEAFASVRKKTEEDLAAHLLTHFPGMPARHVVREAARPVHHTIVEYIRESDADLIIMASHGRTGVSRVMLGSVAEQVIRLAHKPTLIIPSS